MLSQPDETYADDTADSGGGGGHHMWYSDGQFYQLMFVFLPLNLHFAQFIAGFVEATSAYDMRRL